jgi:zinc transport system substrate-binding protein
MTTTDAHGGTTARRGEDWSAVFALIARTATAVALSTVYSLTAHAEVRVVTTLKPLHALVAGVVGERGRPHLIMQGMASPHEYALRPSDAAALQHARVVFWIGPQLETFLAKSLGRIGAGARIVALGDAAGIRQLGFRQDVDWSAGTRTGNKNATHHHRNGGHHGARDPHIWLDPDNAKVIVKTVARAMADVDPAGAGYYDRNAERMVERLDRLKDELARRLKAVRGRRYVVFHDAYQHFESRFGLPASAAISLGDGRLPGARRIAEIRKLIAARQVVCVFTEPQFTPKLVEAIVRGTGVRTGVLDPIGAALPAGPDLYFALLRNNAKALEDCLLGTAS